MCNCPKCNGPGVFLGSLGSLDWFRCRNCGWDFSAKAEPAEVADADEDGGDDDDGPVPFGPGWER